MDFAENVHLASLTIQSLKLAYLIAERIKSSSMRVADVLKVLLSFQVPVQDALLGPFTTPCFKTVSRHVQEIEES